MLVLFVVGFFTILLYLTRKPPPEEKKDEKSKDEESKEGYSVNKYEPMIGGVGCNCTKCNNNVNNNRDYFMNVKQIGSGNLNPKSSNAALTNIQNVQNLKYKSVPSEHS